MKAFIKLNFCVVSYIQLKISFKIIQDPNSINH